MIETHDRDKMVFKNSLRPNVLWTKVASALKGLKFYFDI